MTHRVTLASILASEYHELEDQYGIEITEDGEVWDPVECEEYDSITDWWSAVSAQHSVGGFVSTKSTKGYRDDD